MRNRVPTRSLGLRRASAPVTADNFNRAETDLYFGTIVKGRGIGSLRHSRELALFDSPIPRPNRDTLLISFAVFDFDGGPVTITLPDAGTRFMSMQVIDEDQYTRAVYYECPIGPVPLRTYLPSRPAI
jgi:Protein of unknown function (DUF1254)